MPVVPLDRLPMPNLKIYSFISVAALSTCVYVAAQVVKDPNWNIVPSDMDNKGSIPTGADNTTSLDNRALAQYVSDIFTVMIREPVRVWVSFYSSFILFNQWLCQFTPVSFST